MGLYGNHAYSIINVYEETLSNSEKLYLIKLRNPWGSVNKIIN